MDRLDMLSGPGSLRQEEKIFGQEVSDDPRLEAMYKEKMAENVKKSLHMIRFGKEGPPYPVDFDETAKLLGMGLSMEEIKIAKLLGEMSNRSLSHIEGIRFSPSQALVDEYVKMAENMR